MNCPYDDRNEPESPQAMNVVPKGYKQTEVGVVPEDWEADEIGSLEPFVTSGSRGWAKYYSKSGPAFIRITNLSRASIYIDLSDLKFVTIPQDDSEGLRTALQDGDLLLSITADIGIIGFVDSSVPKPAYINQHIALVRLGPDKVNTKYLGYFLASESSQRHFRAITDQGAKAGMGLAGVRAIRAAFPPVPEQNAIATALSDVDALIAKLDQLIAKERDLKQAAMQELLTGRRRLPGFSGEWELKALGDCLSARPTYGINAPAVPFSDSLPTYIRITDIDEAGWFCPQPPVSVNSAFSGKYILGEGDVVFARTGASVGKSYRFRSEDGRLVFAGFLIRVQPDRSILLSEFLAAYALTAMYWNWVRIMSMRSGQPGINGNEYAELPLSVPSLPEQAAIATVLSDMDAEIAALEARRDKTKLLKQGMMQELLTGRIRLV